MMSSTLKGIENWMKLASQEFLTVGFSKKATVELVIIGSLTSIFLVERKEFWLESIWLIKELPTVSIPKRMIFIFFVDKIFYFTADLRIFFTQIKMIFGLFFCHEFTNFYLKVFDLSFFG